MARRFLEEAQIAGRLEHPGIPPVHELGVLPDSRPFIVMKFIQGQTLAQLIRERPSLHREQSLPQFLHIIEQICQTVAYAHSNRVIHRDLKPANVMVGIFGEVQVLDWGLAKVLPDGPEEAVQTDTHAWYLPGADAAYGESIALETQAGVVMGTPAYMPPEQAQGQICELDQRSDVFALGGILCEILTGIPPYIGGTAGDVLGKAAAADAALSAAHVRISACGADSELTSLAIKCLSKNMGQRPSDAGCVTEIIKGYQSRLERRVWDEQLELATATTNHQNAEVEQLASELKSKKSELGQTLTALAIVYVVLRLIAAAMGIGK
jgi:serine/threonine-protein kinase